MLDAVGDHLDRQLFRVADGFFACCAVTHDSGQFHGFGNPPAIFLAVEFNRENPSASIHYSEAWLVCPERATEDSRGQLPRKPVARFSPRPRRGRTIFRRRFPPRAPFLTIQPLMRSSRGAKRRGTCTSARPGGYSRKNRTNEVFFLLGFPCRFQPPLGGL